MDWYYAQDGQQVGPVSEGDFAALVENGTVTGETLVWHEGLSEWQPYGALAGAAAEEPAQAQPMAGYNVCRECGRSLPADEMIELAGQPVCAACKPVVIQKMREGVALSGDVTYAGFWIRALAKILDGIIVSVLNGLIARLLVAPLVGQQVAALMLVNTLIAAAYTTVFLGKFGATPGKMACGLRVVTADGGSVSYLRAFGRHFAEWLSALLLCIGYLMAAFDEEKRALHDRICGTRVIKSR